MKFRPDATSPVAKVHWPEMLWLGRNKVVSTIHMLIGTWGQLLNLSTEPVSVITFTLFLVYFVNSGYGDDDKAKACFSTFAVAAQELSPCQAWELVLLIPSLDVWAILISLVTFFSLYRCSSALLFLCQFLCFSALHMMIKSRLVSLHSQLLPKSFRSARLES